MVIGKIEEEEREREREGHEETRKV